MQRPSYSTASNPAIPPPPAPPSNSHQTNRSTAPPSASLRSTLPSRLPPTTAAPFSSRLPYAQSPSNLLPQPPSDSPQHERRRSSLPASGRAGGASAWLEEGQECTALPELKSRKESVRSSSDCSRASGEGGGSSAARWLELNDDEEKESGPPLPWMMDQRGSFDLPSKSGRRYRLPFGARKGRKGSSAMQGARQDGSLDGGSEQRLPPKEPHLAGLGLHLGPINTSHTDPRASVDPTNTTSDSTSFPSRLPPRQSTSQDDPAMLSLRERVIKSQQARNKVPRRPSQQQRFGTSSSALPLPSQYLPSGLVSSPQTMAYDTQTDYPFPPSIPYPSPDDYRRSTLAPSPFPSRPSSFHSSSFASHTSYSSETYQQESIIELDYYGLATPDQSPDLAAGSATNGAGAGKKLAGKKLWGFESGLHGSGEIDLDDEEMDRVEEGEQQGGEVEGRRSALAVEAPSRGGNVTRASGRVSSRSASIGSGRVSRMSARECWEGSVNVGARTAEEGENGSAETALPGAMEGADSDGENLSNVSTLASRILDSAIASTHAMDSGSPTPTPTPPPLHLHPSLPSKPSLLTQLSIPDN